MPAPRMKAHGSLIDHLNAQAPAKPVSALLSIEKYYASADMLLLQCNSYRGSKNDEQLYVMLMRFASLVIETIPAHKDFDKNDAKYLQLKKTLQDKVFPELEQIKLSIRTRDAPEPIAQSRNRPTDVIRLSTSNLPQLNWAAVSSRPTPPPAQVNVDDLMDIISGKPSQASSQQPPNQHQSAIVPASAPTYQPKYTLHGGQAENSHTLFFNSSSSSSSTRLPRSSGSPTQYPAMTTSTPGPSELWPRYPSLDRITSSWSTVVPPAAPGLPYDQVPDGLAVNQLRLQQMQLAPSAGPPLGPQELQVYSVAPSFHVGAPGSCSDPCPAAPGPPPPEASVASGPKELGKRLQLRDVHVSVGLMEEFLHFAASNTANGIETCGILAARLSGNDSTFTISTLIIPKQKGTSDTVEMMSEEDVLMVHLERELYPLGWIHTHPTQTCFLSSVDVHTQCGYQTMLDEAVAVVMAPNDQSKRCGIFRLTTPGGLSLVQKCDRRGFHTHPETSTRQELYELCGHVYLNDRVRHDVVDLR